MKRPDDPWQMEKKTARVVVSHEPDETFTEFAGICQRRYRRRRRSHTSPKIDLGTSRVSFGVLFAKSAMKSAASDLKGTVATSFIAMISFAEIQPVTPRKSA